MTTVDSVRREWEEGYRRTLEAGVDPAAAAASNEEIQLLLDELRRQVGSTYSLDELGEAYVVAELWAQTTLAERATSPTWPRRLADDVDAAFHLYSRGALDYAP